MYPLLVDSLLLGAQHSFEPDHMAAVSVLASEKNRYKTGMNRLIWRSSHWALGHSVTLILFSGLALLLKSALPFNISGWAEIAVGPIMVWLGVSAIRRNHRLKKMMAEHKKFDEHEHLPVSFAGGISTLHLHGRQGEEIALNPLSRSFWVGMLHGLAGTGGACAIALTLAAKDASTAVWIIVLQSAGIIITMTTYSCVLAFSVSRLIERHQLIFKVMNAVVGLFSIAVGLLWIYNAIKEFVA
jgi:nickel/cobalt transporter (NicO) family protein